MKKFSQLLLALGAMTLAANAMATVLTYDDSYTDVIGNDGGVLNLAQFNSALGTLQSVQFELVDKLTGATLKMENKGSSPANFTASITGTLYSPYGNLIAGSSTYSVLLSGYDHIKDYGGSSGITYSIDPITQQYSNTYTTPADLLMFIGTGALQLSVTGDITPVFTGPGNASYLSSGTIDAYAKVTYNYQAVPVPEPETYATLLTGLVLMGAVLRKRKRKSS